MIDIQILAFKKTLDEQVPSVNFHKSEIVMVIVEQGALQNLFNETYSMQSSIPAEVHGKTCYTYPHFDVEINWSVPNLAYQGPKGIVHTHSSVNIDSFELKHKNEVVQIINNHKRTPQLEIDNLLKQTFSTKVQDWKTYPSLYACYMQPTHIRVKNEIMPGLEVDDYQPIIEITIPQLKKIVKNKSEIKLVNSYITDTNVDSQGAFMFGFATYRLGDSNSTIYAHLHWIIRSSLPFKNSSPVTTDIALIESDNLPGTILTGAILVDSDGNYLSSEQEIIAILRVLKHEKSWMDKSIQLFNSWINKHSDGNDNLQQMMENQLDIIKERLPNLSNQDKLNNDSQQGELDFGDNEPTSFALTDNESSSFSLKDNKKPSQIVKWNGNGHLEFSGDRIARVIEENDKHSIDILELFKTDSERWVCIKTQLNINNEIKTRQAKVCEDTDQIVSFFGHDHTAKKLYDNANINPKGKL